MTLAPGFRLGHYEILAPLGAGGMGEVYRARDTSLDREVAVKVLPERVATSAEALARFEREAKAVAALSHPNILAIHEFGKQDGTAYAVTELLEGETLRQRLSGGAIPQRKAVEYAIQIANGLAAAHGKGIVHRDLKPENLFVTRDGRVKILDFGLVTHQAAADDGQTSSPTLGRFTDPGAVVGTVGYMSPEQVRGARVDPRTDIFALGAVLYEMLTGQRAFQRETAAETMTAILKEDVAELQASGRQVPTALDRLVRRCLEKNEEERLQSARDLAIALEAVSGSEASGAMPAQPPRGHLRRSAIAGALLLAAAGAGFLAARLAPARGRAAEPALPVYRSLTSRRGSVEAARFAADGNTVVYSAVWDSEPMRIFQARLDARRGDVQGGGEPRPLTGEGVRLAPHVARTVSPDGLWVTAIGPDQKHARYPIEGGEPQPIPGLGDDLIPLSWTDRPDRLFARLRGEGRICPVYRIDVSTGQRQVWRELGPSDPTGTPRVGNIAISPDGRVYAYGYGRSDSDLFLVSGVFEAGAF